MTPETPDLSGLTSSDCMILAKKQKFDLYFKKNFLRTDQYYSSEPHNLPKTFLKLQEKLRFEILFHKIIEENWKKS